MLTGPEDAFGREPIEKKKHRRVHVMMKTNFKRSF
jgi:hypothetical protein